MGLFFGQVAHPDQSAIGQIDDVDGAARRGSIDGQFQRHFVHFVTGRFGGDVELHVDCGRFGPLEHVRRVRIFDREILHILRDDPDRRLRIGAVRHGAACAIVEIGEDAFFVGHWSGVFRVS